MNQATASGHESRSRGTTGRHDGLRLCLLASFCVVVLVLASAATMAQSTGAGRIGGRVTDVEGNPLAGVRVVLTFVATGDTYETTTDDDGRWLKGNMGRGSWNIDFILPGFAPKGISTDVSEVRRMKPLHVELETGAVGGLAGPALSDAAMEAMRSGNALYDAGDFAGARAAYEGFLVTADDAGDPNAYLLHVNAGNAALELEDYAGAVGHYEAVLAHDSAHIDALMGKAKVFMYQRDLDGALAVLEEINPADIADPIVFYNVGSLLYDQAELEPAIRYFELALQRNPEFAEAHMQLGFCKLRQGDMDGARTHFERVVEIDPDSPNAALAQDFLATISG